MRIVKRRKIDDNGKNVVIGYIITFDVREFLWFDTLLITAKAILPRYTPSFPIKALRHLRNCTSYIMKPSSDEIVTSEIME